MNHFYVQQNALAACEEMRGFSLISDQKDLVVCPKPRRVGMLGPWHMSGHLTDVSDSKAGAELLDLILKKEGYGAERFDTQISSPPPFFNGSPPSRAGNPLIQDAHFGDEKLSPFSALPMSSPLSPSSSARKGGCARMKFGLKPATVRVEGFDCLSRDCQNSSIPAFA